MFVCQKVATPPGTGNAHAHHSRSPAPTGCLPSLGGILFISLLIAPMMVPYSALRTTFHGMPPLNEKCAHFREGS